MADTTSPAARTLIAQIDSVFVQRGVEEGRWKIQLLDFPDLYVRVVATDHETGTQAQADFHLHCDGFPSPGPFVERWDFDSGARPPAPTGGQASPAYTDALKDWNEQPSQHGGIYRGWQRIAARHNGWAEKRPDEAWHSGRHIAFILERLHELVAEQAVWLAVRKAA